MAGAAFVNFRRRLFLSEALEGLNRVTFSFFSEKKKGREIDILGLKELLERERSSLSVHVYRVACVKKQSELLVNLNPLSWAPLVLLLLFSHFCVFVMFYRSQIEATG